MHIAEACDQHSHTTHLTGSKQCVLTSIKHLAPSFVYFAHHIYTRKNIEMIIRQNKTETDTHAKYSLIFSLPNNDFLVENYCHSFVTQLFSYNLKALRNY
jgi:hypothetical protein